MRLTNEQIDQMSAEDKIENVRSILRLMSPGAAVVLGERIYGSLGPSKRHEWNESAGGEQFAARHLGATLMMICGDPNE